MIVEPGLLRGPDQIAAEVLEADVACSCLREADLLTVNSGDSARLEDPQELGREVAEVLEELRRAATVSHVASARRIGIEAREGRREYREVDRAIIHDSHGLNAVSVQELPSVTVRALDRCIVLHLDPAFLVFGHSAGHSFLHLESRSLFPLHVGEDLSLDIAQHDVDRYGILLAESP